MNISYSDLLVERKGHKKIPYFTPVCGLCGKEDKNSGFVGFCDKCYTDHIMYRNSGIRKILGERKWYLINGKDILPWITRYDGDLYAAQRLIEAAVENVFKLKFWVHHPVLGNLYPDWLDNSTHRDENRAGIPIPLTEEEAEAVRTILAVLREVVDRAYASGVAYGTDILRRLNNGTLSVDGFDDCIKRQTRQR